jgi:hypothetical protein
MHTNFFFGNPAERRTVVRYRHEWDNEIDIDIQ